MGRSTSKLCFPSCSSHVLPWIVMFISTMPLGINGLLVQLENGPCPCPQEPSVSVNRDKFIFVQSITASVQLTWHVQQKKWAEE